MICRKPYSSIQSISNGAARLGYCRLPSTLKRESFTIGDEGDHHPALAGPAPSYLQSILRYCAKNGLLSEGKACHAQTIASGLQPDVLTSNMLINMYCKSGVLESARQVLDKMPERSIVSWNTIIGAYTQNQLAGRALGLFMEMRKEMVEVNGFTISSVLCACAAQCAISECRQLHGLALKTAMITNVYVGTALLDVYAKCRFVDDASRVFDVVEEKSDVTWSSMVAAYMRNELYEEALMLYHRAQVIGVRQNKYTLSSVLSACAGLAALIQGKQVHGVAVKVGSGTGIFVSCSLVDMYARCGSIAEAHMVFSEQDRDHKNDNVALWNAMLSGFSRHGRWRETMILFEKMQQIGLSPNEVSYVSVLSVCGHMGLVEEGLKYFDLLVVADSVSQNAIHYSCLVDILCRAGRIRDAYNIVIQSMMPTTASMWGSFLSSCRKFGDLELAEIAAKHLFEMEPCNGGNHVLLSDTYAANNKWEEAAWSRKNLKESEAAEKEKGKSWIERDQAGQGSLVPLW
ncbi:hypothetical protein Dimus_011601 [Dionaea muscipula]